MISFFFAIAIAISPYTHEMISGNSISTTTPFSLLNNSPLLLGQQEKLDLQGMVEKTRSYSYGETQLGFYLKDLEFFNLNSKMDAESKILESLPKILAKKANTYVRAVLKMSQLHQVDPIWILSVMWTESNFDYSAKSWAGARGLMQIMPDTRTFIYKVYKTSGSQLLVEQKGFNINEYFPYKVTGEEHKKHVKKLMNIELGIIYLKTLLTSFKSHKYATVAYNMGPGWTRSRLRRKLPVGQKNEYLDKVRKAYRIIVKKI